MRFSIIVTIYDRIEFINKAIDSLENQNFMDFEVIIVTNIKINVNQKYRVIITEKKYLSDKIRIGINNANGDILCFLEDDDLFHENKLSIINSYYLKGYKFVHNGLIAIDQEGNKISEKINIPAFNLSSISISRDIIELEKIPENINIGMDVMMEAMAIKHKHIDIDDPLTYYRISGKNLTIGKSNLEGFIKNNIIIYSDTEHSLNIILNEFNGCSKEYVQLFLDLSVYARLIMSAKRKGIFKISKNILKNKYFKRNFKTIMVFTLGSFFHYLNPKFIRKYMFKRSKNHIIHNLDFVI